MVCDVSPVTMFFLDTICVFVCSLIYIIPSIEEEVTFTKGVLTWAIGLHKQLMVGATPASGPYNL